MKRANVRIRGEVQMAGFQTFIKNIVDSFNLTGFVENQGDGSVKVVCEGEEEGINELINSIKKKSPSFVSIEGLDVAYEEYKGEYSGFERRGADVPGEESEMVALMRSFDKKGEVMIGILSSMDETMGSMNETLKSVKEDTSQIKQDTSQMLEKQDDTIAAVGEVSEKIEGAKEDIVTEIGSLREDLRSYMENKFAIIEHEIEGIKAKIGMV
ncbi:Acylphosphatase [ANME-1 cluster archaeon GoMg1]|nr:Acylphosphatase [ANME-1 cluster archaeon GoMg1]